MANLSWQFFKGYYEGFDHWENLSSRDERTKKEIENFFKIKNNAFTTYCLNELPSYPGTNKILLYTTYPGLLIGSGYAHEIGAIGEFKIGFQFDFTTGIPIIPGSSVKGVIRSAFPEIEFEEKDGAIQYFFRTETDEVKGKWMTTLIKHIDDINFLKENYPLSDEITKEDKIKIYKFVQEVFEGIKDHTQSNPKKRYFSIYDRNIFMDAYPIKGNSVGNIFGTDAITPHGDNPLKNPIPLLFLKILPKVLFQFNFKLKDGMLNINQKLKLFTKILLTFGIGAKTNVGYGQFTET